MQRDSFAAKAITVSRLARRRKTTAPDALSPTRLQTFLPKSTPSTAILMIRSSLNTRRAYSAGRRGGPSHKHDRGWGRRGMRYSPSDKTEIIRLVEQSHLPARRTLEKLGIPRSSFYRWYDRYQRDGPEGLADRPSRPDRVWNRIPEAIRSQIVDLALDQPELSPRELAVRFTDEQEYFVSEASVYRLLKAHDLITSPAYIVIKAAEAFKDKTTAPNQLWQTDFTYLKITGWG